MIDIHTHILPEMDDGPDDIAESLAIAKKSEKDGITSLIATPHFLETKDQKYRIALVKDKIVELENLFRKNKINVKLYPGSEVFLTKDLGKKVYEQQILSLNNTRYILVEFPFQHIPYYVNDVFNDLHILGYTPIIAHPERYLPIMKHPNYLYHWNKF